MKVAVLARGDYSLANRRVELLRSLGVRVFFISLNRHSNDHEDNYHITTCGVGGLRYLLAIPAVIRLLRELNPDLADCHGASSYGIFSWFIKVPVVLSIYGPDLYDHGLRNKITRNLITSILNKADLLSCSSSSLHNYLQPYIGVKDINTAIVPYGIEEIDSQESRREQVREELRLNERNYLFIHTRRMMEFWRVEKVIDAFILLKHEGAKLAFVFPEPKEREALLLEKLKSKLELAGRLDDVYFFQDLPYEKFISFQCAADCFLCVGENDLFANSLIEAMVTRNALILNKQEAYLAHLEGFPVRWVQKSDDSVEIAIHMKYCASQDPIEQASQTRQLHEYAVTKLSARAASNLLIQEYRKLIENRRC